MNIKEHIEEMKNIQENILNYLDNEEKVEENYQTIINIFDDVKIYDDEQKIRLLLHFLVKVSNNYHRGSNFFNKIEQILLIFKNNLQKFFTNALLFNIFKSNKRILLFLLEKDIIKIDEFMVTTFSNYFQKYYHYKYNFYFSPEIKQSTEDELSTIEDKNNKLPDDFYENRKIGENENHICKLIRKDSIEEFIIIAARDSFLLSDTISPTIYETNSFLLKNKKIQLIEYATFYGSIQIFNYLRLNGVELTPSLWNYAIHGRNPEIIHILEEHYIEPLESYEKLFKESIKCHHNDVANYILYNYLKNESENQIINALKYYNFGFIQDENINESSFCFLVKYDYYFMSSILLNKIDIDVNKVMIKAIHEDNREYKKTLLNYAIENENVAIIKLLLMNDNIDVNIPFIEIYRSYTVKIITPLYLAIEKENIEIVKLLLNNDKIDININNREIEAHNSVTATIRKIAMLNEKSALFLAVEKENIEIIKLLLNKENLLINEYNGEWFLTALHLAAQKSNIEIVKLLLSRKDINKNIKQGFGNKKPIDYAKNDEIIRLLT